MKDDFISSLKDENLEDGSVFIDKLPKEVREEVRKKAISSVLKVETHSVAPNTSERIKRVVINAKNNIVNGKNGNQSDRSRILESIPDEDIVELTKSFLIGGWLEALDSKIQLNESTTVYVGKDVDENAFNNCKIVTSEKLLSSSRKDHVLALLYLENIERTGNNDDPDIEKLLPNQEDRKVIARQLQNYFGSYKGVQQEWRALNDMSRDPAENERRMFEWYVSKIRPIYTKGDQAIKYAKKTMGEIIEINRHSDSSRDSYFYLTLPDSFAVSESGEIVSSVEIKAYTKEELKELSKKLDEMADKGTYEPTLRAEVAVGDKRMLLGMDPNAENRFVDLINEIKSSKPIEGSFKRHLDELSTKEPKKGYLLVRVTEDIPQEDIDNFAKVAEKMGFDNLVIQKTPFSREDLSQAAWHYCEKNLNKLIDNRTPARDQRVFKSLASPDTWKPKVS